MNKSVYLGLLILDLSKTVMYGFWHDYIKRKHGEKAKLCYMDTGSFIVHVKIDDTCKDIAEEVETRCDTSNYEIDGPLSIGNNLKKYLVNERLIRCTSYEKNYQTKTQNIQLFKIQQ